jgi:AbrB family looped-hinge helix DNA binding protein
MRITSKGQVTIPQKIREKFGWLPETNVMFEVADGGKVLLVKTENSRSRGQKIVEHLKGRGTGKMSTDEIMALTRGED